MQRLEVRQSGGGSTRPRIALVIDRFDGRGGAEIYTRDLAAWLVERGCDVHVVARSIGAAERRLPLTFHEVPSRGGRARFVAAVRERLAAIGSDVSHDMGAALGCDVFQPHVGSAVACQRGFELAYPAWYRPLRRLLQACSRRRGLARHTLRQFTERDSLIVAVSRRVADDITALHRVNPERIRLIHNGIDLTRFEATRHREAGGEIRRRLGFDADDIVVIAVAHNPRLKGLHVLERVIRRLRQDAVPVRLLACGFGHPRSDDAVVAVGSVDDMPAHYAAADIAVQPSFYDACSLATLESLASGLPVITTRLNGASELITPGVEGFVLENPADEAVLADSLLRLAADSWQRATMGRAGRRLAEEYGCDVAFTRVVAVYAEVVAARGDALQWRDADAADGPSGRRFAA